MAAPWVAAAAGLSAITVNPDILWLCILHTTHLLLPSALRTSPWHCAKGLPPNTDSGRGREGGREMVMEKRAAGHPSHFIAHTPNVFSLQCQMWGSKLLLRHCTQRNCGGGEVPHVANVTESDKLRDGRPACTNTQFPRTIPAIFCRLGYPPA